MIIQIKELKFIKYLLKARDCSEGWKIILFTTHKNPMRRLQYSHFIYKET